MTSPRHHHTLQSSTLGVQVQQDKVDILVELTGHTAHNQLGCMALRPAPVQVTWIGYPNSTGLEAVDYRLTGEACQHQDAPEPTCWAHACWVLLSSCEAPQALSAHWAALASASAQGQPKELAASFDCFQQPRSKPHLSLQTGTPIYYQ